MKKWLIPVFLLGAFLRYYNNVAVALWHDEAFSALYIKYSWGEMMHRIGLDVHPPLYYWILRIWSYIFGNGLLSLRGLSIIFGLLTIWAGYLFVKAASKNERLAVLSAFFLAINPFQIQYSTEARMYTLGTFLVLFSSYLLIKALETNKTSAWIWYTISVSACFYTHYYLFFSVAAQGLYFLYWVYKNKKLTVFWKGMGSYALSAVLFIPWIPTLLTQITRVEKSYWITAPDRWSIPSTIWKMIFGGQGTNHTALILGSIAGIALVVFYLKQSKYQAKWLVMSGLLVPFLAALALSFKQAIYLDRYFVFASLFITIMLAGAFSLIPKYTTRRTVVVIATVILLFTFFKNWSDMDVKNLFFNRSVNKKPGMAAAALFINDNARANDKIYVGSSFIYFTFKYYNHTNIPPLLYSSGTLDTIPHFSGTAILTDADLILDFKPTPKNDTVWLLWTTGFGGSKPNVPGNWQKIDEKSFTDAPGFKGDIIVTEYHVS